MVDFLRREQLTTTYGYFLSQFVKIYMNSNLLQIWDIAQNRMRAMFKGHTNEVNSIDFSPDGRSLVSGSDDHSVRIWNLRDGSSKKLPPAGPDCFLSVVFSPDGRYIAAGDPRYVLWIWDSRARKLVANWVGHSHAVWCVEFTPDGKGLMSGSTDRTIKYWDVSSLSHGAAFGRGAVAQGHSFPLIRSFSGHSVRFCIYFAWSIVNRSHLQGDVRSIAFFPNNNEWFISSSDDKSVRVWDVRTGVWQLVVQGHRSLVREVDISRTGNFLVTASFDRHVTLWRYEVL